MKPAKAVPALNKAFLQEATKFEAAGALAQIPDVRALDAYLFGLGSASDRLRKDCCQALKAIAAQALPLIEGRLDTGLLPGPVILELRQVYNWSQSRKLYQVAVEKVEPAAYLEFALKQAGDAGRGRKLFFDARGAACAKCHRVGGEGGDVGPDLSGVGASTRARTWPRASFTPAR